MTDFVSILDQHARCQPQQLALRAAGRDWSYAALAEASRRAATVLSQQGVGAGDRVALLCYNTPGFLLALFGAWRLGAAVVPINHKLQAPEIDYILGHAGTTLGVFDGALAGIVARVATPQKWLSTDTQAPGTPFFDELLAAAVPATTTTATTVSPASDALAEILYTSGTTGKPKGCLHSHQNVFMTALAAAAGTGLSRTERTLIAMPVWHSSPLNNWLLGTLLMGGSVVLLREYAPAAFLQTLADERISFTFGAPIAFLAPLSVVSDVQSFDLSAMRLWAYGGGPLGADMARKLAASYGSDRFMQVYGMTESGPLGSVLYPEEAIAKAGSIGRSGVPGVAIEVRGSNGQPCRPGEVGEIFMRTPGMMQGYLHDAEATARAFDAQGWYATGDLARIDEDGYLFIVDRLKDMIVTGGENVYSKEVEDAISSHPQVQDAAVVGRPHPEWGETVTAILVAKPGQALEIDELKAFLEPRLARYKIPRIFEVREALPRTATGKLLKHTLRAEVVA
ncbi:fatty-acid--CoA ligase [Corticibacter populi]|uniref:Fatty-acid--CoA ligase n=1 Tax=Corticibacter populi TaxID=1550736 RepID=A0A3M6QRT7_9BURK|nr:AMP-binding protein [Corticibacter populi]RMX05756.1 fatty-acid--CoA ligase [Corticibacter populi]RZS30943.1 feruloyl-CoA synthase [Corticibacter populi]